MIKNRDKKGKFIKQNNFYKIYKDYAEVYFGIDNKNITLISKEDLFIALSKTIVLASGYAYHFDNGKRVALHRIILNAKKGQMCDHINNNTLDNRRTNLRFCTAAENSRNCFKKKTKLKPQSKFKGVTFCKKKKLFRARICYNNKRIGLGRFKDEKNAAIAYNEAAKLYHKEFAKLNDVE